MAFLIFAAITILAHLTSYGAMADYVLYSGEVLSAGQNLTNGEFQLSMQPNCNLVLRNAGKRIWSTNTSGKVGDNCYLGLKQTAELVVRRNVHYTLWSSGTKAKKGKHALILGSNGRIGLYGQRRWITNNQKQISDLSNDGSVVTTDYVLYSGHMMTVPKRLRYKSYELTLAKCNLAIKDVWNGKVLWQTNTEGKNCYLEIEEDGEVTLNQHKGKRLWSNNKRFETGDYVGVLRFDGRFSVYGPLVWSNDKKKDSVEFEPLDSSPEKLVVE